MKSKLTICISRDKATWGFVIQIMSVLLEDKIYSDVMIETADYTGTVDSFSDATNIMSSLKCEVTGFISIPGVNSSMLVGHTGRVEIDYFIMSYIFTNTNDQIDNLKSQLLSISIFEGFVSSFLYDLVFVDIQSSVDDYYYDIHNLKHLLPSNYVRKVVGPSIDISEHYGRCTYLNRTSFVASYFMVLGPDFFLTVDKNKLIEFCNAKKIPYVNLENSISIQLFPQIDDCWKQEYQLLMKELWISLEIAKFEKDSATKYF